MPHLRGRVPGRRHRPPAKARKDGDQGGGNRVGRRLRHLRPQHQEGIRLRPHGQRGHQHGLRAPAVRHRPLRGRDTQGLGPQAPPQYRLDPVRGLAAGNAGGQQLLLGGVLLLHPEAGDPDQGPRRRRQAHRFPQRHPRLRQGLRALLPAHPRALRRAFHPLLHHRGQGRSGDSQRLRALLHPGRGG